MTNIQEKIAKEREVAREACSVDSTSAECANAWDTVEELQAEAAHQRDKEPEKSELEKFCDMNPDSEECRIYED